jgi:hypothetical protein
VQDIIRVVLTAELALPALHKYIRAMEDAGRGELPGIRAIQEHHRTKGAWIDKQHEVAHVLMDLLGWVTPASPGSGPSASSRSNNSIKAIFGEFVGA